MKRFGGQQKKSTPAERAAHTTCTCCSSWDAYKENLSSYQKSFREKLNIHHLACWAAHLETHTYKRISSSAPFVCWKNELFFYACAISARNVGPGGSRCSSVCELSLLLVCFLITRVGSRSSSDYLCSRNKKCRGAAARERQLTMRSCVMRPNDTLWLILQLQGHFWPIT